MASRAAEVLVVGGGIGGLSAALALSRLGIPVRVFERASELREVGAGLGLWMNALRVLDRLGVGEEVRRIAWPLRMAEVCSSRGAVLSRLDLERVLSEPGAANSVMHRAELQAALAAALPEGVLETGAEFTGFEQDGDGVVARFAGREPVRGSLLVGADGIHSVVRAALWGADPLRYSGQTCFRGIAEVAVPDPQVLREVQGPGRRAGICPLDARRVYWWAALNAPADGRDRPRGRRERLLREFAGWPFGIPEAIAATDGEILRNDLVDRAPLRRWSRGRATLLGDAAHPMLPNLGQGACTAIEDALVLARAVGEHGAGPGALREFERQRIGRTTAIVKQSWNFGIPVRWRRPWAVRLREALVRSIPARVMARQVRWQVGFDAGPLRAAVEG